jgi:hypothetical protein
VILDLRAHGPATLDAAVDEALLERLRAVPALDPIDLGGVEGGNLGRQLAKLFNEDARLAAGSEIALVEARRTTGGPTA